MKANELMIGDWVYDEDNKLYTKVIAVTPIRVIIDPYTEGDEEGLIGSDLKGIPLTEEILEENGFVLTDRGFGKIMDFCNLDIEINNYRDMTPTEIYRNNLKRNWSIWWSLSQEHKCSIITSFQPIRKVLLDIHYVHELQHALRLCGLNELADNFKLKVDEQ